MRKRWFYIQAAAALLIWIVPCFAGPIFSQASYTTAFTFVDNPLQTGTRMTLAFDGTYYWSVTGGGDADVREARYTATGALDGTFSPGLDFRSVTSDGSGAVYARAFMGATVLQQTTPGTFVPYVTLVGGALDDQSSVVWNSAGDEFIAQSGGTITRWNTSGALLGTVTLIGFAGQEGSYPQGRGIAAFGNYYLTYSEGVLSAWNTSGVRVDSTTLTGASTGFEGHFSFSYANGMAFVNDGAADGGTWRGYDVGLGDAPDPAPVPEPATALFLVSGLGAIAFLKFRRK